MRVTAIVLLLVFVFSCKKDEIERNKSGAIKATVCGVNYPVQELPWLRKLIQEAKDRKEDNILTVKLVEVNGNPIFNYYTSYMSCIGCISYGCDGGRIDISKLSATEIQEYNNKMISGSGEVIVLWPEK